jgi:hypothetical protein
MTSSPSTAAIITALIAAAAAVIKKFVPRAKPKPEYITRAEFHAGLDTIRDRIGASYLALADKIELQHNQVLTVLDRQGASFESRLDRLDTAVARLEERTHLTSDL